jgi:hypothetical protein
VALGGIFVLAACVHSAPAVTKDGNPHNFIGYPDYVGRALEFTTVNAACPGEATSGFLSLTGADNGAAPSAPTPRFM